jgi:hypothetical protein
MTAFGIVLGTNLLAFAVVLIRSDIVWCVAATWIAVSLWSATPKPAPVHVSDYAKKILFRKKIQRMILFIDYGYNFHCSSSYRTACKNCIFQDPWW